MKHKNLQPKLNQSAQPKLYKKLMLHKETLRELQNAELTHAIGGAPRPTRNLDCMSLKSPLTCF